MKAAPHSTSSSYPARHASSGRGSSAKVTDAAHKLTAEQITVAAVVAATDQKAHDVRALSLEGVSDIADTFVIASGTSDRHVKGIADKIRAALRELGELPTAVSGHESGEWIALDYGSVVVHVFHEAARQYYLFDELWSEASEVPLNPELEQIVRKLRTGMITR